ncbi:MAG: chemotaxis protein CheD [Oscillibacter sp.]|uniref:chemotaxis protein CheD n=1 Tax=Oscillibacter sp. TaxID=1945593 RepID=UPI002898C67B|nr:chemotaxis protein CheD [Oscillibacter sp.]MEA4992505.1 chemotaxis protein CheD [Oscillibacter sp.]
MNDKLIVGIADMKLTQDGEKLITYALGSCIGICLYEPNRRLAALIHIMLPLNMETGRKNTFKYADTGIRATLREMEMKGASRAAITAKIAGGARMFEVSGGSLGNIGQRNGESVRQILKMEKIRLAWEDVGGTVARTMEFDGATGNGIIRSYGYPEIKF